MGGIILVINLLFDIKSSNKDMNILKARNDFQISRKKNLLCLLYNFSCFQSEDSSLNSDGTAVVWELDELNCHPLKSLFLTGQIFQNLLLRTF